MVRDSVHPVAVRLFGVSHAVPWTRAPAPTQRLIGIAIILGRRRRMCAFLVVAYLEFQRAQAPNNQFGLRADRRVRLPDTRHIAPFRTPLRCLLICCKDWLPSGQCLAVKQHIRPLFFRSKMRLSPGQQNSGDTYGLQMRDCRAAQCWQVDFVQCALTQTAAAQAANYPFCTIEPNVGEVAVPEPRLGKLAAIAGSKEIIPARMNFVDIAGLVEGRL